MLEDTRERTVMPDDKGIVVRCQQVSCQGGDIRPAMWKFHLQPESFCDRGGGVDLTVAMSTVTGHGRQDATGCRQADMASGGDMGEQCCQGTGSSPPANG